MKMKMMVFASLVFSIMISSCSKSDDTGGGTGTGPGTIAAKTMMDVAYGTDPLQKMDIYLPANRSTTTTKVIILIHGGGWITGDKSEISGPYIDTLKKRVPDYAIFNVNYRLAAFPNVNTFPTQELDIKAAIEFIYGNRSSYLIGDKFVILGGSAGGHLALLHAYKYNSPVKIKAVVDFYGPTDMVDMYNNPGSYPAASIALLLNGTPTTNAALYQSSSPLTYATAANACPTIILQGSTDLLVNPTTQSLALKNKLATAGVVHEHHVYTGIGHGPWDVATTTDAFNKIQVFLAANVP